MIVKRVERHIILKNKRIDELCFLSKNLYNYCDFILRQLYLKRFDRIEEYKDLIKEFTYNEKIYYKINEYDLITRLTKINQTDYRALPAQTSQQVIILLYKNWKSFFKSIKAYSKDKSKFKARPNLPRYKDKIKGRNLIIFTRHNQIKLKNGYIHFPKKSKLKPLKTKVNNIDQVRIIPQSGCYAIEVIYKKEVKENKELDKNLYLGIDLGVNNLATCISNQKELQSLLLNGRVVKSINQYYNKNLAFLKSELTRGKSVQENKYLTSNRIKKLTLKRNNLVNNCFHHTSRFIIDYCTENKIKTIVIGKNDGWKQEVELGRINNQNFVYISFNKLIEQLKYKGEEIGIKVIETEESYTSKCSSIDLEELKHHKKYKGRRISRDLFRSKDRKIINADINGAINILRKVLKDDFVKDLLSVRGFVSNPLRVNVLKNSFLEN